MNGNSDEIFLRDFFSKSRKSLARSRFASALRRFLARSAWALNGAAVCAWIFPDAFAAWVCAATVFFFVWKFRAETRNPIPLCDAAAFWDSRQGLPELAISSCRLAQGEQGGIFRDRILKDASMRLRDLDPLDCLWAEAKPAPGHGWIFALFALALSLRFGPAAVPGSSRPEPEGKSRSERMAAAFALEEIAENLRLSGESTAAGQLQETSERWRGSENTADSIRRDLRDLHDRLAARREAIRSAAAKEANRASAADVRTGSPGIRPNEISEPRPSDSESQAGHADPSAEESPLPGEGPAPRNREPKAAEGSSPADRTETASGALQRALSSLRRLGRGLGAEIGSGDSPSADGPGKAHRFGSSGAQAPTPEDPGNSWAWPDGPEARRAVMESAWWPAEYRSLVLRYFGHAEN